MAYPHVEGHLCGSPCSEAITPHILVQMYGVNNKEWVVLQKKLAEVRRNMPSENATGSGNAQGWRQRGTCWDMPPSVRQCAQLTRCSGAPAHEPQCARARLSARTSAASAPEPGVMRSACIVH